MIKYDFHALLNHEEFESLAIDIVSIRENLEPNMIRKYPRGRDFGIDGYRYEDGTVIQAKCYKNDYDQLYNNLKYKEISKVCKLKPKRYILVTSVTLNKKQEKHLLDLFQGYIHSANDIISAIELNQYLSDPKYADLEYKYQSLWMPSTSILKHILEDTFYRNENNFHQIYMDEFKESLIHYIKTDAYYKCKTILKNNNCIIISGEPGIGKSQLGYNLGFYYKNLDRDIELLFVDTIEDIYKVYKGDRKQVFIVDDFLGINRLNDKILNEESRIYHMLNNIIRGTSHKIILISRRNILYEGMDFVPEIKKYKEQMSIELSQDNLSTVDKQKIVWSILKRSCLTHGQLYQVNFNFDHVVHMDNFNPRHIDETVSQLTRLSKDDVNFTQSFREMLNNPIQAYNNMLDNLNKKSKSAIYLGVCLAIFGKPVELNILKKCYGDLIEHFPSESWQNFEEALGYLSSSFCFVRDITFTKLNFFGFKDKKTFVAFNNHSMLDYWITFISENLQPYATNIIKSINLMNVPLFFSNKNNIRKLINEDNNFQYIKFIIPQIIEKINKDFKIMDFIYLDGMDYYSVETDYVEYFHLSGIEDSVILKLKHILKLNTMQSDNKFKETITLLKNKFFKTLLDNDLYSLTDDEKYLIPEVFNNLIEQEFEIPSIDRIIKQYHSKINFLLFYKVFYKLRNLNKTIFDNYVKTNYEEIVNHFISLIYNDMDYYLSGQKELQIEMLLFNDIPEVFKLYNTVDDENLHKGMKNFEETLLLEGYKLSWDRSSLSFISLKDNKSKIKKQKVSTIKADEIEYLTEEDEELFLLSLLPNDYWGEQNSWEDLREITGIQNVSESILLSVKNDLFLKGSKWKEDYYNIAPGFFALVINEYKRGNNLQGNILTFFDNLFTDIKERDFNILSTIAILLMNHREKYFNKNNLKLWINIGDEDWRALSNSIFIEKSNGWLFFIAPEVQVYLISRSIILNLDHKEEVAQLINWIIEFNAHNAIYNSIQIVRKYFPEETTYNMSKIIGPFLHKLNKLDGIEQIAFGLSSVYKKEVFCKRKKLETMHINDYTLLKLLDMLEVNFVHLTADLSETVIEKLARNKSKYTMEIIYDDFIKDPKKLLPIYNNTVERNFKNDLIKIDNFIKSLN